MVKMSSHRLNKCKKLKFSGYKLLLKLPRPLLNCRVSKLYIDAQKRATNDRIGVEEMVQQQKIELEMLMKT